MPELAEVYFHASKWKAARGESFRLERLNRQARCCRQFDPKLAERLLNDVELLDGYTHGKRMLFAFAGGACLEVHLGMTGSLAREKTGYEPSKHDHLVLAGRDSILVFRDPRMFGKVALHESSDGLPSWWRELPPEPRDARFTRERFDGFLDRFKGSALKPLLLKQELFPGVGNWMADEILWQARVRPDRKAGSLTPKERAALYEALRFVCREAIHIIGADYSDPPETWLFRHRWRDGGLCPKSGKPLRRESIGGRTTCWSPAWQR